MKTIVRLDPSEDLVQIIIDNIDPLLDVLRTRLEDEKTFVTTFGRESRRMGSKAVNIINLFVSFLSIDNSKIQTAIGLSQLFPVAIVNIIILKRRNSSKPSLGTIFIMSNFSRLSITI